MWVKLPMMGVLFVCFWLCGGASLPPNLTDNDYCSLLPKFMHFSAVYTMVLYLFIQQVRFSPLLFLSVAYFLTEALKV